MKSFVILGGKPLVGNVTVSGSKNSALPILFATVIARGESIIENLPKIGDTEAALTILSELGADIRLDGNTARINTESLVYSEPSSALTSLIRASTYLIGSLLARFGRCRLSTFGGCNFADRPIDIHLDSAYRLGAIREGELLLANSLHPAEITLRLPSVGATVNTLLLASSIKGKTVIRGFAREPHILTLIDFLRSAGAKIELSDGEITVEGGDLHGGRVRIDGDVLEAATFLTAGAITNGRVGVLGVDFNAMNSITRAFSALGLSLLYEGEALVCERGEYSYYTEIVARPYPGFPTDLQPIFAPLFASLSGGKITDTVWRERFGYLDELARLGVKSARLTDGALIYKSKQHSGTASSPDLRGGMSLVLSALHSRGESRIYSAEKILRGYESLDEKLSALGADIKILS
ncbi:MAG: UDP-N-acetylglucosamine 1-carboxyvinyltransferase [Clostridia bacterium]|nr:UDP-N-acetylglucosamine 1-carboxyvinyltransferase [Clostridia bacterium]